MRVRERKYTWYVEPLNSGTNLTISACIEESSFTVECKSVKCADGKKHNLWKCNFDFVKMLHASKNSLSLNFNVYTQEGKGPIRPSPKFLHKKRKKQICSPT